MRETEIDCMKYRKSTHLAGVDVEAILLEKGKCIVTIKEAYYEKQVNVSGNKTDGYFIEFLEDIKPMVVNSINKKTISNIVKLSKNLTAAESRNISNWKGLMIELYFDEKVTMLGKQTGGIRIKSEIPIINKIDTTSAFATLQLSKTIEELSKNYFSLSKQEQQNSSIIAEKDRLKGILK
jgi:hypothetical protein